MTTVTDGLGESTTYEYDLLDREIKETLPNGIVTTKSYDKMSHLLELDSVGATGETILSQLIKYDSVGNKVSLEEVSKKNILTTKSEQYEYDKESRITKLVSNGVTEKFFYDTVGNRIQKETYDSSNKKNPLVVSRYVYNDRNQLITSQGIGEVIS